MQESTYRALLGPKIQIFKLKVSSLLLLPWPLTRAKSLLGALGLLLTFFATFLLALSYSQAWAWQDLDQGLELGFFPLEDRAKAITIVRINPANYGFLLCSQALEQTKPKDLEQWAKEKGLVCAINASMYIKDGQTSTGYLREDKKINNPRHNPRFGAFFVAHPDLEGLPEVDLLERQDPNLKETLAHYRLVIQNYRLIASDQRILWPKVGERHAVAAVGLDKQGRVLFIYCGTPTTPHALAQELLRLPLELKNAMYVEGGSEAGLYIAAQSDESRLFPFLSFRLPLPNVLGVYKKNDSGK
ncbi:MAG: phosphodiester glycosidase family protein [Desulfovibrio sp.]|nr:phosphodiester glycosidase family protein [Desulfovibrio sp.]